MSGSIDGYTLNNPDWKDAKTCDNPRDCKSAKEKLRYFLESAILQQFGSFEEDVCAVVEQQNKGTDSEKVARPGETHEQDGGHVVDKHHPEVFPSDIDELGKEETPVERQLSDVVPPDVAVYGVVRIVIPAVRDVPKPVFVPQTTLEKEQDKQCQQIIFSALGFILKIL